ncbi:DUF3306 domain-containing protein [Sedimenticola selenatireducens]|uniref:DUF3306 domain-containing protein n=1 Tax=Sedimenticola selenatireducens TaxID=191960 RepID=A0A557RZY9_9GAMM|nr:DUF3306 domain-containing protein [Sedimenticola selenatireducens]TVO70735.1 DUF3306 domain-containing protein [Sedimenticola selenatireducens]TVT65655.1 MAG: DUF3306 domain-containing protein [Sedimenticola selenatireducens]
MSSRDREYSIAEDQGGFISRWSRMKQATQQQDESTEMATSDDEATVEAPPLSDEDMPPIESLTEASDYSVFFSEKVSEALRQQALRKLFHSASFNVCDGLDDYADDFTSFAKLGSIITSDMRHQMAVAKEKLEAALQLESDAEVAAEDNDQQAADGVSGVDVAEEPNNEAIPLLDGFPDESNVDDLLMAEQPETEGRIENE